MIVSEIRRLYIIIRVILNYELYELIPVTRFTPLLRLGCRLFFWISHKHSDCNIGRRLCLALQELGPVWIKFGQMLSIRCDLLPLVITNELAILQNQVQPFDGCLARKYIEKFIGCQLEILFDNFQKKPLATASISQVHSARLKKNGKEIVIKLIRPDIMPIIKSDMRLMYRLAKCILYFLPNSKHIRPVEIVSEYEKILINEMNLLRETANTIKFRNNFENSNILYIPEVYPEYCNEKMMVMERIYGIPINDFIALKKQGTNMKLLAERGVQIFFTQVFRDNFFHGDMHPGNILVSYKNPKNPQYIGIDCGIVGSLDKKDKRYLAENFIAFFNRDYHKIAKLHIDLSWISEDTSIEQFECAIRTVFEPIFEKPFSEISFGHILLNLFNTSRKFNIEIQPKLLFLQKTLLYIEGIGKQLYPQLDLWKTVNPFFEKWVQDETSTPTIIHKLKEYFPHWIEKLPELPELIHNSLNQHRCLQKNLDHLVLELKKQQMRNEKKCFIFYFGVTLTFNSIFLLIYNNIDVFSTRLIIFSIMSWILIWMIPWIIRSNRVK